jgi:hypothetical protein
MKKVFLVGSMAAAIGFLVFCVSSCKEKEKTCTCYDNRYDSRTIDLSSYGAANCSDLELKLKAELGGTYRCQ